MLYMFILLLISLLLMLLNFTMSKKTFQDREKSSPFECGFDPMSNNRPPFSIHFFLISLIFLIFDVEITLLIPIIQCILNFNLYSIITSIMFLMILIYGLYMEYSEQSMDWKI
uniref:NADH-ubiquinone oxidoreductase chain 3 n=2 Tax=Myrmicinae TaxID=34695 RepID=A0A7L7S9S7_9HYME|nr:NADH dehydrogenase subunit 3 [Tetramorium caespitum]QNV12039.1 NADH dehydrogenase subunit 3 [Leptothorax acervorum]